MLTPSELDGLQIIADRVCERHDLPTVTLAWKKRYTGTRGLYYYPKGIAIEQRIEELSRARSTLIHELAHHLAYHKLAYLGHAANFRTCVSVVERTIKEVA